MAQAYPEAAAAEMRSKADGKRFGFLGRRGLGLIELYMNRIFGPKFNYRKYWSMNPTRLTLFAVTAVTTLVVGVLLLPSSLALGLMLGLYIPPYLDQWYRQAALMIGG